MLQEVIKKIVDRENLSENEAYESMDEIMKGFGTESQIGAFLSGIRVKGETIDEITGCAKAMRDNGVKVKLNSKYAIDTCGTGGDGGKTFNISTAVAIIAAAGGVNVAKHGNRAVSSRSGSADVLTELGIAIDLEPDGAIKCIDETGMAFLFAQKYHTAMKNVAGIRKELGIRTIFNILGPLTNPASVKGQFMGVYNQSLTGTIAQVLSRLGCEKALVVHGADGLDEITTTALTYVSEIKDGEIFSYSISPEDFGISYAMPQQILGGTAKENAEIIMEILNGMKGPKRDIVVLNSAAALYVGNLAASLKDGVKLAQDIIDSGKALSKINQLIEYKNIMQQAIM